MSLSLEELQEVFDEMRIGKVVNTIMGEAIILLALTLFAVLYIFGYVHNYVFWLCDKRNKHDHKA